MPAAIRAWQKPGPCIGPPRSVDGRGRGAIGMAPRPREPRRSPGGRIWSKDRHEVGEAGPHATMLVPMRQDDIQPGLAAQDRSRCGIPHRRRRLHVPIEPTERREHQRDGGATAGVGVSARSADPSVQRRHGCDVVVRAVAERHDAEARTPKVRVEVDPLKTRPSPLAPLIASPRRRPARAPPANSRARCRRPAMERPAPVLTSSRFDGPSHARGRSVARRRGLHRRPRRECAGVLPSEPASTGRMARDPATLPKLGLDGS